MPRSRATPSNPAGRGPRVRHQLGQAQGGVQPGRRLPAAQHNVERHHVGPGANRRSAGPARDLYGRNTPGEKESGSSASRSSSTWSAPRVSAFLLLMRRSGSRLSACLARHRHPRARSPRGEGRRRLRPGPRGPAPLLLARPQSRGRGLGRRVPARPTRDRVGPNRRRGPLGQGVLLDPLRGSRRHPGGG